MRLAIENMGRNETGYVDVSTFGKAGEAAARVLSKGWLVAVDGRLDYRHWVADDGANRSAISVVGNVEFLAAPRATAGRRAGGRLTTKPRARRRRARPTTDCQHDHDLQDLLRTPRPHRRRRDARLEALWRMTPDERVTAMRRGNLTLEQCCAWAAPLPRPGAAPARRVRVHRRLHTRGPRMTPPDIRAFYAALGIELPGWSKLEAPVRCFAQPDAHNHADRSPSCSVNLASGAWNCHGCGAHGGAYDAALAVGNTPRSAMDLLIANGLAEPRTHTPAHFPWTPATTAVKTVPFNASRPQLAVTDADVHSWADMLDADGRLIRQLILKRAWAPRIMRAAPSWVRRRAHHHPHPRCARPAPGRPPLRPLRATRPQDACRLGTRLGLIPHPSTETCNHIILVEGPPDMIAARSAGLPAIAIPGTNAWHAAWAELLASRRVTIVMDCDAARRHALLPRSRRASIGAPKRLRLSTSGPITTTATT